MAPPFLTPKEATASSAHLRMPLDLCEDLFQNRLRFGGGSCTMGTRLKVTADFHDLGRVELRAVA